MPHCFQLRAGSWHFFDVWMKHQWQWPASSSWSFLQALGHFQQFLLRLHWSGSRFPLANKSHQSGIQVVLCSLNQAPVSQLCFGKSFGLSEKTVCKHPSRRNLRPYGSSEGLCSKLWWEPAARQDESLTLPRLALPSKQRKGHSRPLNKEMLQFCIGPIWTNRRRKN